MDDETLASQYKLSPDGYRVLKDILVMFEEGMDIEEIGKRTNPQLEPEEIQALMMVANVSHPKAEFDCG